MVEEEFHRIIWLVLHANLNQCFGRVFASWVSFGSSSSSGPAISNPALKGLREMKDILYTGQELWAPSGHTICPRFIHTALQESTHEVPYSLHTCGCSLQWVNSLSQLKLLRTGPCPDDVQSFCIKWKEHLIVDFRQLTFLLNSSPLLFLPITSLAFSLISAHHHLDLIMSYIIKNPGTTCKYPTQGRTS